MTNYNSENFEQVDGTPNHWWYVIRGQNPEGDEIEISRSLFVGREGQTLESLIAEFEAPLPTPSVTSEQVNRERQRRIQAGKLICGVLVTGRDEDARNLQALLSVAQIRIDSGDTATTAVFRDGNNVDHDLTPAQIVNLFLQSSAYVSDVYAASWALKALDPVPANYTDDSHWPNAESATHMVHP